MTRKNEKVTINNWFSGQCVGIHLEIGQVSVPSDGNGLEHKLLTNQ